MRAFIPVLLAAAQLSAQSGQAPVFRSGVEVMEVDVTVVDAQGRPIRDLRAPEFTVTVDGQPRRVVSAEFISDSTVPSSQPAAAPDPYVSNNTDRRPGRLIMLVIDRNNIDTQTVRQALAPLKQFVGSLAPDDRVAVVTIPPPGPSVDFTSNHGQVIEALGHVTGRETQLLSRFNISDYEALVMDDKSNALTHGHALWQRRFAFL